ncbi:riboflavin synthase [Altererythrobacter sp. ZODW24]|uniref:riboflavin synthase n=1 Tax=Altererythrobacter sp. ZODW24 TaxID=2185142 RepID=UPI000DF807DE|nr:riboflavin synthase [Altererythrobacter sp. ZODW24]
MFTGIITAIGTIDQAEQRGDLRARISCPYDPATIAIGASIACSGVCLTVVERGGTAGDAWFAVDVSGETIACSVPGMWEAGARLNLETALKLGDELGGHIVTGHVDAVGTLETLEDIGGSHKLTINAPKELAIYLAPKGSITLNGASLTVNEVSDREDGSCDFTLNIIPHTWDVTTLGDLKQGDHVNLEVDTVARYLQRMQQLKADA